MTERNGLPTNDDSHALFLRLFLSSERELFRYVAALVPNLGDAEEIVQQTAVELWKRFDQYDAQQPFTPWACRFAINVVKQWVASRKRWQMLLDRGLAEQLTNRRDQLRPLFEKRLNHLDQCLEKLPPEKRGIVEASQAEHQRDRRRNAAVRRIRLQDTPADTAVAARVHRKDRTNGRPIQMNFPSTQFDDAVAAACQGEGSEADIAALHATLQADEAARDEYLCQVELHAYLASLANGRATVPSLPIERKPRLLSVRRLATATWAAAAAILMIAFMGGIAWQKWNGPAPDANNAAGREIADNKSGANTLPMPGSNTPDVNPPAEAPGTGFAAAGIYRDTVRFACAADAPIIVGTGRQEPIELGAEIPYSDRGDTLHVWDWSQSKQSRVMKDIRLWPDQIFCLSPDGTQLVWAKGDVLNLTSSERSTIDLGGEFHVGHEGGTLQRITHMQFTPDGRKLALLLSNLVLSKSSHPLRRQDLATSQTFQIVEFPSGKLVSEFPAGNPADLPLAFSADGKRAFSQYSDGNPGSKIVERDAHTGEVRREYAPSMGEFAGAIGLSADGSLLAAYDGAGNAFLWETGTGKLKHKVPLPQSSSSARLRFSPDGKLLALSLFPGLSPKLVVIDVSAGTIVAAVPQESSGDIHWSADSQSFDVIYDHRGILERKDKAGRQALYNMFPSIRTWKIIDLVK